MWNQTHHIYRQLWSSSGCTKAIVSTAAAVEKDDDIAEIEAHARRTSCCIYMAVAIFSMSASIANSALWVATPVSSAQIPEGAKTSVYLLGLLHVGNLSAVAYLITRRFSRTTSSHEVPPIYICIGVSIAGMALLAFFWHERAMVWYGHHSVVYLAGAFCVTQITCLASVTYIPFVSRMKATYISAVLLGEATAGLLPHVLALAQGVGTPPECQPETPENRTWVLSGWRARLRPSTTITPDIPPRLRFNESIYFFTIAAIVCLSGLAFLAVRCVPSVQFEYDEVYIDSMDDVELSGRPVAIEDDGDDMWKTGRVGGPGRPVVLDDGSVHQPFVRTGVTSCRPGLKPNIFTNTPEATPTKSRVHLNQHGLFQARGRVSSHTSSQSRQTSSSNQKVRFGAQRPPSLCLMLTITFWASLITHGPLSSSKAHACLPVGNNAFLAGTIFTKVASIVAVIVTFRVNPYSRVTLVVAFTSLGTILLTYFFALIAFSYESESKEDSPIFGNTGELLTTVAWVAVIGLFYFARVTIAVILRQFHKEHMIWYAGMTQLGVTLGSLCMLDDISICRVYRNYLKLYCNVD